jgi:hypothetical protein
MPVPTTVAITNLEMPGDGLRFEGFGRPNDNKRIRANQPAEA